MGSQGIIENRMHEKKGTCSTGATFSRGPTYYYLLEGAAGVRDSMVLQDCKFPGRDMRSSNSQQRVPIYFTGPKGHAVKQEACSM